MKYSIKHLVHYISILFTGIILLLIGACSEEPLAGNSQKPIRLTASNNAALKTRAAIDLQGDCFEGGQRINVYITNIIDESNSIVLANGREYMTSDPENGINILSPANNEPVFYANYMNTMVDISAYYPASVTKDASTFSVSPTQTTNEQYMTSDLMYAHTTHASTDQAIHLQFDHKMAKVIVYANVESGQDLEIEEVKLNLYPTVGLTPGTAEPTSSLSGSPGIVLSNMGAALVPPQTIIRNTEFLEIKTNYGTAKFSFASDRPLEGGREYALYVSIGRQVLGLTSTITNWSTEVGTSVVVTSATAALSISDISPQPYTGSPIEPEGIVVYYNDAPLTLGTDYRLQFYGNTNVGTATVIAIGLGNTYSSAAAVKSFTITQATGSLTYPASEHTEPFVKEGKVNFTLNKIGDGTMTYTSSNTDVATIDPSTGEVTMHDVGTSLITATMAGDHNYTGDEASYTLTVEKKGITNIALEYDTHPYTGKPLEPSVTVYEGSNIVGQDNYTVSYSSNTGAGQASVTVTGIGAYEGTVQKSFTITKAPCGLTMSSDAQTISEGSTYSRVATTTFGDIVFSSSNPEVASVSSTGTVTAITGGTATITAKVEGNNDYDGATISYQVSVQSLNQVFEYTGSVQSFTALAAGRYKLEVYGAAGGSVSYSYTIWGRKRTYSTAGGNGGYATGIISLNANQTIYIYVGGKGGDVAEGSTTGGSGGKAGSYASGGNGGNGTTGHSGGGGASYISSAQGDLSTLAVGNLYIVAGGGGGAALGIGGAGGGGSAGDQGYTSNRQNLAAATQSGGNARGVGGTGVTCTSGYYQGYGCGGGGGGYYGGYANTNASISGSGSGGSGYTGSVSSASMNNNTRRGDGFVRITYQQ